jgi:hypothetical protein
MASRFGLKNTATCIPGRRLRSPLCDANDQSLAYVYSPENSSDAHMAEALTEDEARRIASSIAKLPTLLSKCDRVFLGFR